MIRFEDTKPKRASKAPAQPIPREGIAREPKGIAMPTTKATKPRQSTKPTKAAKKTKADTKATATKAPRVLNAPLLVPSMALAAIVGAEPISRPQIMKKMWDHIKANGLQDTTDKRRVNCDPLMQDVYNKPQIGQFEVAKFGDHVGPVPAVTAA